MGRSVLTYLRRFQNTMKKCFDNESNKRTLTDLIQGSKRGRRDERPVRHLRAGRRDRRVGRLRGPGQDELVGGDP